jgi:hypothetical protein
MDSKEAISLKRIRDALIRRCFIKKCFVFSIEGSRAHQSRREPIPAGLCMIRDGIRTNCSFTAYADAEAESQAEICRLVTKTEGCSCKRCVISGRWFLLDTLFSVPQYAQLSKRSSKSRSRFILSRFLRVRLQLQGVLTAACGFGWHASDGPLLRFA